MAGDRLRSAASWRRYLRGLSDLALAVEIELALERGAELREDAEEAAAARERRRLLMGRIDVVVGPDLATTARRSED